MQTLGKKSLVIITGASRGIGRAIASSTADAFLIKDQSDGPTKLKLTPPAHLVLIARSSDALEETSRLVEQRVRGNGEGDKNIVTTSHPMDLSDLDTFPEKFDQLLKSLTLENYNQCWLINNAGSVDPLGPATSFGENESSLKMLRRSVDLNVTSAMWISSQFAKTFLPNSNATSSQTKSPLVRIVNVSSLCAIEPFPTMSVYCAGKAARNMFHSVLSKENSNRSQHIDAEKQDGQSNNNDLNEIQSDTVPFKVLNYAPGACDTHMTDILSECNVLDEGLHNYFSSSKQESKLIRPEDTALKLVGLLMRDEFESGSHIDYWDV